ncbi:MAG: protein-glutamate O-methyltransferase CheR [Candidatus Cloacimonetes bacterium]|nr:protein-glutamate O-methyltransferase CheR [Candidatus Cloacimonadota bacterium]
MHSSKIVLNHDEFVCLREYIHKECGIPIGDDSASLIESRLARLVMETDCADFREFYKKAKHDESKKLRNKIIDAMTTHETLWFRDSKPWDIIRDVIIPQFIADLKSGRKQRIHVWSAAASTGQEPYSFAMLLHEALQKDLNASASQFHILGTDISPSALYMAYSGRYNNTDMLQGMKPGYKERCFEQSGQVYQLIDTIRQMVEFKKFDLMRDFAPINTCDLIFCRNVSMYFSSKHKSKLYRKLYEKLGKDGYLIIGSSESLMGYSEDFEQLSYKQTPYFRPKKIERQHEN